MINVNEFSIRDAILGGGITAYTQPIVALPEEGHELKDGVPILSFEFLARLIVGEQVLTPGQFMPVAESDPVLFASIDHQVLRKTVYQLSVWKKTLGLNVHAHVNASQATLTSNAYAAIVESLLTQYNVSAEFLTVEVLETCQNFWRRKSILRTLRSLNDLGVKVAIDDLGPGWKNMPGLMRWVVSAERDVILSAVKIDQSVVKAATSITAQDKSAVQNIMGCCGAMRDAGISVVAEGVETQAAYRLMRELGCGYIQGYVFGKPQSLIDTTASLKTLYRDEVLIPQGSNKGTQQRQAAVLH